jgi:hypothetical protein
VGLFWDVPEAVADWAGGVVVNLPPRWLRSETLLAKQTAVACPEVAEIHRRFVNLSSGELSDAAKSAPIPAPDGTASKNKLTNALETVGGETEENDSFLGLVVSPVLITAALPALSAAAGTALGAWLGARSGRRVRVKIGDIEAEAHTREEVETLLARAQEIQQQIAQRNQQPKVIP